LPKILTAVMAGLGPAIHAALQVETFNVKHDGAAWMAGTSPAMTAVSIFGDWYKLAAAVRAWNEVTADPESLNGKTPKKALEVWLRKHANEYGLTNDDGNPNKLGIQEICKVANWKPAGGASPTPGAKPAPLDPVPVAKPMGWVRKARPDRRSNSPTRRPKPPTPSIGNPEGDLDDDIPF